MTLEERLKEKRETILRICAKHGARNVRVFGVVHAAEVYQLPAPDFAAGHRRTMVTIDGPRDFEEMDRDDRIRACYQHCALQ